jgi:hypothetical protein
MARLSGLRRAQIGGRRAPHKPLLLLWRPSPASQKSHVHASAKRSTVDLG